MHLRHLLSLLLTATLGLATTKAQSLSIDHGPYLQDVATDRATFVFTTSKRSVAYVELWSATDTLRFYQQQDGLRAADTTFFAIKAEGLQPATRYSYRIHAKEIKRFRPYKVEFGADTASAQYSFTTLNPRQRGSSLFATADMHDHPSVLANLLRACDYESCDAFFFVGDMMSYMERKGHSPFTAFIDTCVSLFATEKAFQWVRGNHETRGDLARHFSRYAPQSSGRIYGAQRIGDAIVIMLDVGEDKADRHEVYAGLIDFDAYRTEQAEWLRKVVRSKEFKQAKYRIVMSHFPIYGFEGIDDWKGCQDAYLKFMPILNDAKIDLMISGHTHRLHYAPAQPDDNRYPVLEQGHKNATRLDLCDGTIRISVRNAEGKEVFSQTIEK